MDAHHGYMPGFRLTSIAGHGTSQEGYILGKDSPNCARLRILGFLPGAHIGSLVGRKSVEING